MGRTTVILFAGAALGLAACGQGTQTAEENAATNAALATAAQPSAGTVSAAIANATDPGPPPVTLSEAIEAQSDEADPELRAKVAAANRIVPADSPEATPGR
jgi:hypothetical protein